VVALDGACNATYQLYRVKGNFDRVIANVRRINRFKEQYGSDEPVLIWQFVLFGHNEHEIGQARRMAAELGMRFAPKLNAVPEYSPLVNPGRALREAGLTEERANRNWQTAICNQLWKSPQINWNGKILGCCHNNWAEFGGNAFEGRLVDSLNGERLVYARKMLRGKVPPRADIPCTSCESYRQMASRGTWVNLARIRLDLLVSRMPALRRLYATLRRSRLRALMAPETIGRLLKRPGWSEKKSGPRDLVGPVGFKPTTKRL
jgi:Iron-sulfur cluster-binding domain